MLLCLTALLPASGLAQSYDLSARQLLQAIQDQPSELARYSFLVEELPKLAPADQMLALQFLAFSQNELGLYTQAALAFPLKSRLPDKLVLPTPAEWKSADAVDTVAKLAAHRQIVLINEAHHNAYTRTLTLALLPRLRALGFSYFAAEALLDNDPGLTRRGYPIDTSGTEYLREPIYGDLIREAIRLGFVVVPYDAEGDTAQARETGQAENLYRRIFAKNPAARVVVHAGYAHIDKAQGRLGPIDSMAMRLQALTGLEPLSVDQIEFLQSGWDTSDAYHQLIAAFPSAKAAVLVNRIDGKPWSDQPTLYDVNVILPPSLSTRAFGSKRRYVVRRDGEVLALPEDNSAFSRIETALDYMQRPDWLTLDGQRQPYPISTTKCRLQLPCLVEAHYANETDSAIAADRYVFLQPRSSTKLYLRPGRYRLRISDVQGKTLSEWTAEVAASSGDGR